MQCPGCQAEISDRAVVCTHCGRTLVASSRAIHLPRWGWALVAVVLIIGVIGSLRGSSSSNPAPAAKETPSTAAPTAPVSKPAAAEKPTAAPAPPTATLAPAQLRVTGTGGQGLSIRRTPGGERIKVWPDGALMVDLVDLADVAGQQWRKVRDPDGNEGWAADEFLLPTLGDVSAPTAAAAVSKEVDPAARADFLSWGPTLWGIARQSDAANQAIKDAGARVAARQGTSVDLYRAADASAKKNQELFATAQRVQVGERGKAARDALQHVLVLRKEQGEKLATAVNSNRPADIVAAENLVPELDRAMLRFASQIVAMDRDYGTNVSGTAGQ